MSEEELDLNGEKVEQTQEQLGQQPQQDQNQEANNRPVHPFDTMFFGTRHQNRPMRNNRRTQNPTGQNETPSTDGWLDGLLNNKHLSNVNLDELMKHVDQLIISLNELKPMFQKVSPLIERFIQKDKEESK
ncbi:hypothetical protein [Bacillus sp. FJAT-49736]|uniref:hypothetical protein n=1 Tax=Bacillus sp. FJAT-49736 TaxID=2833582 RepID=UPI001BC9ECF0|nr:hypothetical protein [Bacillus sp. FJAT-49736]MBS4172037.1 hypothetical protein [Bacillus sp. FJAT-49736]